MKLSAVPLIPHPVPPVSCSGHDLCSGRLHSSELRLQALQPDLQHLLLVQPRVSHEICVLLQPEGRLLEWINIFLKAEILFCHHRDFAYPVFVENRHLALQFRNIHQ